MNHWLEDNAGGRGVDVVVVAHTVEDQEMVANVRIVVEVVAIPQLPFRLQ